MKRSIILAAVLTICALFAALFGLFEFHTTLARTIGTIVGVIAGLVALLQVFNQQNFDSFDPRNFWFWYSGVFCFIIFGMFCVSAVDAQHSEGMTRFIAGLSFSLMPMIGGFIGLASKVVWEAIWDIRLF